MSWLEEHYPALRQALSETLHETLQARLTVAPPVTDDDAKAFVCCLLEFTACELACLAYQTWPDDRWLRQAHLRQLGPVFTGMLADAEAAETARHADDHREERHGERA